ALCDSSGEVEVWRFAANGSGPGVQITHGAGSPRDALFPSPDGKWIAHFDLESRLHLTALSAQGGGASRVIDTPPSVFDPELAWSSDSKAIAFTRPEASPTRNRLMLYTLADGKLHRLTSERYAAGSPAFTPDGKWLYFISDRNFVSLNPAPWGDRNMGPYFDRRSRVYALALQPGLRFPFKPHDELEAPTPAAATTSLTTTVSAASGAASSSVTVQTKAPAAAASAASAGSGKAALPAIVVEGLAERLHEVPLVAGNYDWVATDGKRLYLLEADSTPEHKHSLRTLTIDNTLPQPELFAADVRQFELTRDGKKMLVVKSVRNNETGDVLIVDAAAKLPTDVAKNIVRWGEWQLAVEPRAEWRQMFADAWRMHRDIFYDASMLGVDWKATRQRYEPLLARVTDRAELDELLGQMVSELHTLHSQVGTRDLRQGSDDVAAAGLGGRYSRGDAGDFRVDRVYRSDPELPSERAPLAQAEIREGELITAVNGRRTADAEDLSQMLRGHVGRQVLLDIAAPNGKKKRQAIVVPVSALRERQLATGDWEQGLAERVATRSGSRIGYLRLRAMGPADIATFAREFYANVDREGLIIDVRGNNGGNIDSWIIEKLLRRAWSFWQPRAPAGTAPYANMQQTFRGHLAVLIDEQTYSDGETFAEGIKRLKLGSLIGVRTAGAGVWLSDRNRLSDNGIMRAAQTPYFAPDGTWLVEGIGVTPDIEVENLPRATFDGGDAQLDAAIAHLQKRINDEPVSVPKPPRR
ncbi:MAG: S41 family peptidase, partial [Pseudomonadota bacterium]|nr:S41 family peptidase [Pseudomonadota bacterium]